MKSVVKKYGLFYIATLFARLEVINANAISEGGKAYTARLSFTKSTN